MNWNLIMGLVFASLVVVIAISFGFLVEEKFGLFSMILRVSGLDQGLVAGFFK